jgi:hypothetical protein
MDTKKFRNLIKESLTYFDKQNLKYKNLIDLKKKIFPDKIIFYGKNNDEIDRYNYEVLSTFYNKTKVWMWGWMWDVSTPIAEGLLKYGLKIDSKMVSDRPEFMFIKSQLINSRILLENKINLDIQLALSSYLIKDKCIFLCQIVESIDDDDPEDFIIRYLIIKK